MPEDQRSEDGRATAAENDPPAPDAAATAAPEAAPDAKAVPASIDEARPVAPYHPSYVFLALVTLINLVADQWSKHWAKNYFESARPGDGRRVVVIEDFINLIYAKNRGGAWGLLQNETEALRRPFFLIVSVAAIVFIVSLYRKLVPGQRALKWGLPLVLGGALGNLIDRIRFGYVIDFIDVYMNMDGQMKHWPTFNIADISICVGVALMAIDMFSARGDKDKAAPKDGQSGGGGASKLEPSATSADTAPGGEGERDSQAAAARGG